MISHPFSNLIVQPQFLNQNPDFKSALFSQLTLFLVAIPILSQVPFSVSALVLVLLFGRVGLLKIGVSKLKTWQLLALLAVIVMLVLTQVGSLFGLQGGMSFLLLLGTLKSFEGHSRRDWQVLALVQVFLLTGAILFDQSLLVGMWVMFCLAMITTSLAMLNELPLKMAWKQSIIGFLLTILPMVVLFIAMPRKNTPLWGVPQPDNQPSQTGLSESMKPGSIGDLVQSNEPAFTATFSNGFKPRPQDLYWRVMIMAENDGNAWQVMRQYNDLADISLAKSTQSNNGRTVDYQIVFEDFKGRVPALDYPTKDQPRRGVFSEAGAMVRVFSRQGARGLELRSTVSNKLPHKLTTSEMRFYTKLPNNTNLKTIALSKSLFEQSGKNVSKFINLAYQYFQQQGFSYTLKPPVLTNNNIDDTDEFLFQTKQGFCEHYADAFVRIMRSAGVASRVVTGYQGGEWNEQGQFWQIRSKDAHAWAEVWLPDEQVWQRVDPTSAVSANRIEMGLENALPDTEVNELLNNRNWWNELTDNSKIYWERWVVNFDNERQQNLFSLFGFSGVSPLSILLVVLVGCIPALLPLFWWYRRSQRNDVRPMEDGLMLLKKAFFGSDGLNGLETVERLESLGALEFKQFIQSVQSAQSQSQSNSNKQTHYLIHNLLNLIDEYVELNYANSHAPERNQAMNWFVRAKKLAKSISNISK